MSSPLPLRAWQAQKACQFGIAIMELTKFFILVHYDISAVSSTVAVYVRSLHLHDEEEQRSRACEL